MNKLEDSELLTSLKNQEKNAYELLYSFYYPFIERFILKNNGSKEDAEDVFQETILVLHKQLQNNGFGLTSSLKTYLYSISNHLWLNRLRKSKKDFLYVQETMGNEVAEEMLIEVVKEKTLREKVDDLISKIPNHCQRIIRYLFFMNEIPGNVLQKLGYKNNHTASNQKYKCIQQLKKASENNK